jgi:hypothetical protein
MRKWTCRLLVCALLVSLALPMSTTQVAASGNPVEPQYQYKKVLAGPDFTVALSQTGTLWAWGNNDFGQLGDGTTEPSVVPVRVSIPGDPVIVDFGVSTGSDYQQYFVVALDEDGHVWHWGRYPALSEPAGDFPSPVKVTDAGGTELSGIQAIAVGGSFAYALTFDNRVYSWGVDYNGELGQGTGSGYAFADAGFVVAESADPLQHVVQIAAGRTFGLALTEDGTVYAWGSNKEGQLARDGSITSSNHAVDIPALGQADAIFTSGYSRFAFAATVSGAVYGWGENKSDNLGTGPNGDLRTPVVIDGLHAGDIRTIRPAGTFTMLLKKDGTLLSSGFSSNVLGSNSTTFETRHYDEIPGPIDDVFVSYYQVYLLSGGTGWALGWNEDTGLLGTGHDFYRVFTPVPMVELREHELTVHNVDLLDIDISFNNVTVRTKDRPFSTHAFIHLALYRQGEEEPEEAVMLERSMYSYDYDPSDSIKEHSFEDLPPGIYELELYTSTDDGQESEPERHDNGGAGYAVGGNANVTVRVTSRSDGQPVAGGLVRLVDKNTNGAIFASTDEEGTAAFAHVKHGLYAIFFEDDESNVYHAIEGLGLYVQDGDNQFDLKTAPRDEVLALWPEALFVQESGKIAGSVSWRSPAAGVEEIEQFRLYFVDSAGQPSGSGPLLAVDKVDGLYQYSHQIPETAVPDEAVAVAIVAFDGSAERSLGAKSQLWRNPETRLVTESYVIDTNTAPEELDLTIHWKASQDESGIVGYQLSMDYRPEHPVHLQGSYYIASIPANGQASYSYALKNSMHVPTGMALHSYFLVGSTNEERSVSPGLLVTAFADNVSAETELPYTGQDPDLNLDSADFHFFGTENAAGFIGGRMSGTGPETATSFDIVFLDADGQYAGSLLRVYKNFSDGPGYLNAFIPSGTPVPQGAVALGVYARNGNTIGLVPAVLPLDGGGSPPLPRLLATAIGRIDGNEIQFIPEGTTADELLAALQPSAGATAVVKDILGTTLNPQDILLDDYFVRVQDPQGNFADYIVKLLNNSLRNRLPGFGQRISVGHLVHYVNFILLGDRQPEEDEAEELGGIIGGLLERIEPIWQSIVWK